MQILFTLGILASLVSPHIVMASAPPTSLVATSSVQETSSTTLIAILAKKYGQDPELAKRIIACESQNIVDAHSPTDDFGYFQINQVHFAQLRKMGLDRTKWQDNLEFGFYLMKRDGLAPWKNSEYCWKK